LLIRHTRVSAPAKLNLGLRVVGRRADGYHELESLMLPLDLGDELELEALEATRPDVEFRLEGAAPGVPRDAENLAARAAERLLAAAGIAARVRVRLRKVLPAGSGLGGGSSDAAATLRALVELFPDALPPDRLAGLALELGADVPFFLDPRPALVTGIGERIQPLAGLPSLAFLLANPGSALSTEAVFRAFDASGAALTPRGPDRTMRAVSGLQQGDLHRPELFENLLENDLEPAASSLCREIPRLRERVRASGALAVGMSGSGPTLFGVFEDEECARAALPEFGPPLWARVAKSVGSA
jgi:4-diphosphocytidyl-2-C-methyl-D-erythritol kinase